MAEASFQGEPHEQAVWLVLLSPLNKTEPIFVLEYDATDNLLKAHMWAFKKKSKVPTRIVQLSERHGCGRPFRNRPTVLMAERKRLRDTLVSLRSPQTPYPAGILFPLLVFGFWC